MNARTEDLLIRISLRIDKAREELLELRLELEDSLLAVEDMKRLPREVRESLQQSVREAYEDCMDAVKERAGRDTDVLEELRKRRPVA